MDDAAESEVVGEDGRRTQGVGPSASIQDGIVIAVNPSTKRPRPADRVVLASFGIRCGTTM
ncbi:MAG: hypothetical protein R3D80_20835 [Paracoccaceae bacterium]